MWRINPGSERCRTWYCYYNNAGSSQTLVFVRSLVGPGPGVAGVGASGRTGGTGKDAEGISTARSTAAATGAVRGTGPGSGAAPSPSPEGTAPTLRRLPDTHTHTHTHTHTQGTEGGPLATRGLSAARRGRFLPDAGESGGERDGPSGIVRFGACGRRLQAVAFV